MNSPYKKMTGVENGGKSTKVKNSTVVTPFKQSPYAVISFFPD